jgi:hypothetical protein
MRAITVEASISWMRGELLAMATTTVVAAGIVPVIVIVTAD